MTLPASVTDYAPSPEWETSVHADFCLTCGWPVFRANPDDEWTHEARNPVEWTDRRAEMPADRVRVQMQTERRPMAPWITVDGTLVPASELEGAQRFRAELGTFLTVDLDTGRRVEVSQVLVSSLDV